MSDHPPLVAVTAALAPWVRYDRARGAGKHALRALDTDPVREWAATVPCLHSRLFRRVCYPGAPVVHPECLLAALAKWGQP